MNNSQTDQSKMPKVSVIIPAYNAGRYISETIDSVLKQTYNDLEIIIVNDGSTDNTLNILQRITNERVRIFDIKNSGVSYARNFAVDQAKGQWLAFIDADDVWLPNKLSIQFEQLDDCSWSYTNSYYIGEEQTGSVTREDLTKQPSGEVFNNLIQENFLTTSTVLIRKSLFIEAKGFDESLEALEDWKLWLLVAQQYPIAYCKEPLAQYRVYEGSTSRKARKMLPLHLKVINDISQELPHTHNTEQIIRVAKVKSYSICSYIAEDSRDFSFALSCATKALINAPFSLNKYKRVVRCLLNKIL